MAVHEDSLYSAGDDRSIRVWNAKTFEEEKCVEVCYIYRLPNFYKISQKKREDFPIHVFIMCIHFMF